MVFGNHSLHPYVKTVEAIKKGTFGCFRVCSGPALPYTPVFCAYVSIVRVNRF